jgi:hypothetical protein
LAYAASYADSVAGFHVAQCNIGRLRAPVDVVL